MAGWTGFTDEDLKQIKQTSSPDPPSHSTTRQQAIDRKQKLQQQRELALQRSREFAQNNPSSLPSEQRLSTPRPEKTLSPLQPKDAAASSKPADTVKAGEASGGIDVNNEIDSKVDTDVKELDEKEALSKEFSKVEQYRLQQQKMEEENKHRRHLLAEAIKQRSKMARAEAEKLTKVQKELSHLDSLVNADVAIIRDRIEAASMDFLQAQKRYERAEKEFVATKMLLVEKSEVKESLTEHLYTVIQQNELRKAERLATLMKELGLEAADAPVTLSMPPLLSFSPLNTLHKLSFPPTPPASNPTSPDQPPPENVSSSENSEPSSVPAGTSIESADKVADKKSNSASTPELLKSTQGENSAIVKRDNVGILQEGSDIKREENGSPESQDGGADTRIP